MDKLQKADSPRTSNEGGLIQLTKEEFFTKLQTDLKNDAVKMYGTLPSIQFTERNGTWDETIIDPKTKEKVVLPAVGIYQQNSDGTKYILENELVGTTADGKRQMRETIASSEHDKQSPDVLKVTYNHLEGTVDPGNPDAKRIPELSRTDSLIKHGQESNISTTDFEYKAFEGETKPRVISANTKFVDGHADDRSYTYDYDEKHVLTGKHWLDVVHQDGATITTKLDSDLQPDEHWTMTYQQVTDKSGKVTAEFKAPEKKKS
jgi:hypothetical protein